MSPVNVNVYIFGRLLEDLIFALSFLSAAVSIKIPTWFTNLNLAILLLWLRLPAIQTQN